MHKRLGNFTKGVRRREDIYIATLIRWIK